MGSLFHPDLPVALFNRDVAVFINGSNTAAFAMLLYRRVFLVHTEIGNFTVGTFSNLKAIGIVRIENGPSGALYCPDHYRFYPCKVIECVDIRNTKMIFLNISHYANITGVKTKARPQYSPSCSFQHGNFNGRIF
ncbi:hypothetical protein D9M68_644500 [compost metagenome]